MVYYEIHSMNIVIYKVKIKSINLSQLRVFCKCYVMRYHWTKLDIKYRHLAD